MVKIAKNKPLKPSILDRLLGSPAAEIRSDDRLSYQRIEELRQSIRRDLENLLNTRFRVLECPDHLHEMDDTILNYGLPDLATINMIDPASRQRFCRYLSSTIQRFEPRFKNVKVYHVGNADEDDRSLRFRIEALLFAEPISEPIIFNSILEPVTRSIKIEDMH